MRISKKIFLYFSLTTILLLGIALFFIYSLFAEYREEEFQQRQKEKIATTLRLLSQVKQTEVELVEALDSLTINDLYDEKLLLFNSNKELIYSSLDDAPVSFSKELLFDLNVDNKWIELKDGLYDVIGTYIENDGNTYFGISKAFDTFGYSKLNYLKDIFIAGFVGFSIIIILASSYLANVITRKLITITNRISNYDFEDQFIPIEFKESKNEIEILAYQFNRLMERMNEAYAFQKHAVHHISHELKTPIAVIVSNFERIEKETDLHQIQELIKLQKEDTKSLGQIIDTLLEIAKSESTMTIKREKLRIDDLLFDVSDELKNVYPDFQFSIEFVTADDEDKLMVNANRPLIKAALMNLMVNCIQYSNDNKATVRINSKVDAILIAFENRGSILDNSERQLLFHYFFRGKNSRGKRGFGLGLVLIHKIIALHGGEITYATPKQDVNAFNLSIPLS